MGKTGKLPSGNGCLFCPHVDVEDCEGDGTGCCSWSVCGHPEADAESLDVTGHDYKAPEWCPLLKIKAVQ